MPIPTYDQFVKVEGPQTHDAYRDAYKDKPLAERNRPSPGDMNHVAWRRIKENWEQDAIIRDIYAGAGVPFPGDSGGGPVLPPPTGSARKGQMRGEIFQVADDGGPFLGLAQSLFYGFGSYAREREFYEENLATTRRLSDLNRQFVCGLRMGTNERSLLPSDPKFKEYITGALNLAYDQFGQRTGVTVFGAQYPAPTEQAQLEVVDMTAAAINAAGPHKVGYVEIANEGWTNGFVGDAGRDRLFKLCVRFAEKCPGVLLATTCPEVRPGVADDITKAGVQYYYKGAKATFITEHYARKVSPPDGIWRHTKKVWREKMFRVDGCPTLRMNQEPMGPESSGNETNDPLVLAMDAVVTWLSGCSIYLLHTGAGIHGVFNPRDSGPNDDRPAKIKDTVNYDAICTAIEACRNLLRDFSPTLPNYRKFDSFDGAFKFVDVPEDQFAACYSAAGGPAGKPGEKIVQPVWGVTKTTTWKLKSGAVDGRVIDPLTGNVISTFDKEFTVQQPDGPVKPGQRAVLVLATRTA